MNYWQTCTFDFFNHCCAATCAGSSRGGHDYAIHAICFQFLSVLSSESFGGSNSSTVTNCGVEFVVEFADSAFFFHFAENVYWQNAVSVFVSVYWVVTAVSCCPMSSIQIHNAFDVVFTVVGSGRRLDVVWVAQRNDTTGCAQSNCCMSHVFNSWVWCNTVEGWHWELSGEWFAIEFSDQHLNSTCRTSFFFEQVYTNAVWHVAFFAGSADCFMSSKFESEWSHFLNSISHTSSAVLCSNDVNIFLEHISAWVFNVHTSQNWDVQVVLNCFSDSTASYAVTTSVECRTSDEHVWVLGFNHLKNFSLCFFKVFVEVGVTTDDGCNNFCFVAPSCIECETRTYWTFTQFSWDISFFLATDLSEELVNILYYSDFAHRNSSPSYYLADR